MQQIVDLQNSSEFQALDVALVSITADDLAELSAGANEYGVTTPLLSDRDIQVSTAYDVMKWATPAGEPSHTFILVDAEGEVVWIRDYGSSENEGVMYVPVEELVAQIKSALG